MALRSRLIASEPAEGWRNATCQRLPSAATDTGMLTELTGCPPWMNVVTRQPMPEVSTASM